MFHGAAFGYSCIGIEQVLHWDYKYAAVSFHPVPALIFLFTYFQGKVHVEVRMLLVRQMNDGCPQHMVEVKLVHYLLFELSFTPLPTSLIMIVGRWKNKHVI